MGTPTHAAAAAAAALLESGNSGGRYGPSSHMYEGFRPTRYDFGSMWSGEAAFTNTNHTLHHEVLFPACFAWVQLQRCSSFAQYAID
jgi:hypothetical protein